MNILTPLLRVLLLGILLLTNASALAKRSLPPDVSEPLPPPIPCQFNWAALVLPDGSTKDFTTPAKQQPYMGPCVAFAYAAAIEAMYEIEGNRPEANIDLSEAHIDYKFWAARDYGAGFVGGSFGPYLAPTQGCGNFPRYCTHEEACRFNMETQPFYDSGQYNCFSIDPYFMEDNGVHKWQWEVNPEPNRGVTWFGVKNVQQLHSLQSQAQLKRKIMEHGPVIVIDNAPYNRDIRNYPAVYEEYELGGIVGMHAFILVGWFESNGKTIWRMKDSWTGGAGFVNSKPNPGLITMHQAGTVDFYQLSGVYRQKQAPGTTPVQYDASMQCPHQFSRPPTVEQIIYDEAVLRSQQWSTVESTTDCRTSIVAWEFDETSSSVPALFSGQQHLTSNGCSASVQVKPLEEGTLTVRARAKASNGQWSPWKTRSILVDNGLN